MTRRSFLASAAAAAGSGWGATPKAPNVIFILCDDLGYGDLGSYGSRIRTPNLDRMAAEGVRFTNFCSADPVCSPSRAALLTGRYPTRVGVPKVLFPQDAGGLNEDERTLADLLKARGYRTMCVGKWHLGRPPQYLPTSRGFDRYFGIPYSNDMNPRVLMRNTEVIEQTAALDTLTPRYTDEAKRFIEESKGSPFFLYCRTRIRTSRWGRRSAFAESRRSVCTATWWRSWTGASASCCRRSSGMAWTGIRW